ncbi:MAG: hypothetical protein Q9202_006484 [Teloschistes flavicans]
MLSSSSYTERLPKRGGRNNAKCERLSRESDCERRRRVFLHKIQQKRDDRKWGSRNEQVRLTLQIFWIKTERRCQMLREDFLAFERLWTEQQDRSAPFPVVCPDDDDLNESTVDARFHAEGMFEEILARENAEMEALVSMFEERQADRDPEPDQSIKNVGEDDSYDPLFTELLSRPSPRDVARNNARHTLTGNESRVNTKDAMDTTSG